MNDELHLSNSALRERQDEVDRLNRFMSSVLGSLRAGVAVVGPDLRVLAWNASAEDLWGIREDEAEGQDLFNLDIGLPMEELKPLLRRQFGSDGAHDESLRLAAVNRRGRPLQLQVTVSPLAAVPNEQRGAILLMDVLDSGPAHGAHG
jgi:two-component system CheB/CheR fusion protein